MSQGVYVLGGKCPGGKRPGVYVLGVSVRGGYVLELLYPMQQELCRSNKCLNLVTAFYSYRPTY